jgi:hypothetical protein
MVDGHPLQDPFYKGETIWYNPLTAAAVAIISIVTKLDVPTAFVQAGPFLNALAPLALFAMVAALFGPWPAFLAVVSLLFSPTHDNPPWSTPTYSPWLFPANFGTAFFYLGLLVSWMAIRRNRFFWWMAAGATLGVTFLVHTAPALILGTSTMVGILSSGTTDAKGWWKRRLLGVSLVIGTALLVAAPLVWSIVVHYHLRILNPAPNNWVWDAIDLGHLPSVVRGWFTLQSLFVVTGGATLAWTARRDLGARLVCAWVTTCGVLFAYGLVKQGMRFGHLPALLPNYHFYLYLRAASHVLTGVGLWRVIRGATTGATRVLRLQASVVIGVVPAILAVALAVTFTDLNLADYRRRVSVRAERGEARKRESARRVMGRLRTDTAQDAVILAWPDDSLLVIAPAGRSVVAIQPEFSNPYVDFELRAADQRRMLAAFVSGDREVFTPLAARYGVTHVLLGASVVGGLDLIGSPTPVVELPRSGFAFYDVRGPRWQQAQAVGGMEF